MAALILYVNGAPGIKYELDKARITIGRELDNDICLEDPCVSKYHAYIETKAVSLLDEDREFHLVDLDSTNACIVNNERTTRTLLNDGDTLRLGNQLFKFAAEADRPAPMPATTDPAPRPRAAAQPETSSDRMPTEIQVASASAVQDFDTSFSRRLRTF